MFVSPGINGNFPEEDYLEQRAIIDENYIGRKCCETVVLKTRNWDAVLPKYALLGAQKLS